MGCGNGRFAHYAEQKLGPVDYVGIDSSPELLGIARRALEEIESECELQACDLTHDLPSSIVQRTFDLVVAFGLMHHVPSRELRRDLLVDLASLLEEDGLLAVGFWQFGESERFLSRTLDWDDYNRSTDEPIDPGQLEEGDYLLVWGEAADQLRYCHYASPDEVSELLTAAGFESAQTYRADGEGDRLNLYALVRPAARRRA